MDVKKNNDTNRYYKKMVRIIKKMRYLMCDCGYKEAELVSSFGLESHFMEFARFFVYEI